MEEEVTPEIRQKVDNTVEKAFALFIDKASKGSSLEELLKSLITEKVMVNLSQPSQLKFTIALFGENSLSPTVSSTYGSGVWGCLVGVSTKLKLFFENLLYGNMSRLG